MSSVFVLCRAGTGLDRGQTFVQEFVLVVSAVIYELEQARIIIRKQLRTSETTKIKTIIIINNNNNKVKEFTNEGVELRLLFPQTHLFLKYTSTFLLYNIN